MSATLLNQASLESSSAAAGPSGAIRWTGRIATALAVLFLAFDVVIKLIAAGPAVQGTTALGFAADRVVTIGAIELVCLVLYLVPRTATLGAVLWTGYLGGAIAAQLRAGNPLFSHVLFPTYVAALLWGGLYARDARVRALFGPRFGR